MENNVNIFVLDKICTLDYKNPKNKILISDAIKYYAENNDTESLLRIKEKVENLHHDDMILILIANEYYEICLKIFDSYYKYIATYLNNAKNAPGLFSVFRYVIHEKQDWDFGAIIISYLISLKDISVLLNLYGEIYYGYEPSTARKYYSDFYHQICSIIFDNVTAKDANLFYQIFSDQPNITEKYFEIADLNALSMKFDTFFSDDVNYITHIYGNAGRAYVTKIDNSLIDIVENKLKECNKIDNSGVVYFFINFILGYVANASSFAAYKEKHHVRALPSICIDCPFDYADSMYPAKQKDIDRFEELFFAKCLDVELFSEYLYYKSNCTYIKKEDSINTIVKLGKFILAKYNAEEILYFVKRIYIWSSDDIKEAFKIIGYDTIALKIIEKQNIDYIYEITNIFADKLSIDTLNILKEYFIKCKNKDYICGFCLIYPEFDLELFNIFIKYAKPKQIYNYILTRYISLSTDKINLLLEGFSLNKCPESAEYLSKIANEIDSIDFTKLQAVMDSLNLSTDNEWGQKFVESKANYEENLPYQNLASSTNIAQTLLEKDAEFIRNFRKYLEENINMKNNYQILKIYGEFLSYLERVPYLDSEYVSLLEQQKREQTTIRQRKLTK